jgi:hypothetical protein
MKAMVLDGISRDLGDRSTRRGFVRFLGSVAAVGAVAVVGSHAADAKKGKRRNKKRKRQPIANPGGQNPGGQNPGGQNEACRPGTLVASLAVPYNNTIVQTPVLTLGQVYTFRASGAAAASSTYSTDAEYGFLTSNPNDLSQVYDFLASGIDAGLSIDDPTDDTSKSPKWGAYNPSHVYETQFTGKGAPAQLKMHDGDYSDNSGSVLVTITCA